MDILTYLAHEWFWGGLRDLDPIYRMFILRWAVILIFLFAVGWFVRYVIFPKHPAQTLLAQVLAVFVALVIGFWFPLDSMIYWSVNVRNTLLSVALIGWIVFPYFIPHLLIRSHGYIQIAWRSLYALELILVIIQAVVGR
jgi:hypothetical protein